MSMFSIGKYPHEPYPGYPDLECDEKPLLSAYVSAENVSVQLDAQCSKSAVNRTPYLVIEADEDQEDVLRRLEQVGLAHRVVLASADQVNLFNGGSFKSRQSVHEHDTSPPYFQTTMSDLILHRTFALAVLLLLQSASSLVLASYQELIEKHVFLALFLTMLTGTGGNAGNQSSALVIRGLSTGEIGDHNRLAVLTRELVISSVIGPVLAGIAFVRVMVTEGCDLSAGVIISITTYVTVVGAIAGGTVVPLILDRIGFDPCHLSGPILATLTDVMGVLLLCVVTTAMLSIL